MPIQVNLNKDKLRLIVAICCLAAACRTKEGIYLNKIANSYCMTWNDNKSFIFLSGYLIQSHKGDDVYKQFMKNDEASIKGDRNLVQFSADSITVFTSQGNTGPPKIDRFKLVNPVFPQHLYLPVDRALNEPLTVLESNTGKFTIEWLSTSDFVMASDSSLDLDLVSNKMGYLDLLASNNLQAMGRLDLRIEPEAGLHPVTQNAYSAVAIYHKQLGRIELQGDIHRLTITDCEGDSATRFFAQGLDTLYLIDVQMRGRSRFTLPGIRKPGGTGYVDCALSLRNTDISKIDVDYTKFTLVSDDPHYKGADYNGWYSTMDKEYADLILNQEKSHNEGGKEKAIVERKQFKDLQQPLGGVVVWVKTWWNNYGYDKSKVLLGTAEVFLFFFVVNLCFFKPLVTTVYKVNGVTSAYNETSAVRPLKRQMQRWILCLLYTGFIFFGLTLDLDKLDLGKLGLTMLVIVQFVVGLVCLGYLANLVIAK